MTAGGTAAFGASGSRNTANASVIAARMVRGSVGIDHSGAVSISPPSRAVISTNVGQPLASYAFLWPALGVLRSGAVGRDLIPVLARTGQFQLIWSVLLAIGLAVHRFL